MTVEFIALENQYSITLTGQATRIFHSFAEAKFFIDNNYAA